MCSEDFAWDLWPSKIINTGLFWLQLTCFTKCWINSKTSSVFSHTFSEHPCIVADGAWSVNDAFLFFLLKIIMGGTKWPIALQVLKTVVVIPFSPLAMDQTQCFSVAGLCTVIMSIWCGWNCFSLRRISKLSKYLLNCLFI